MSYEIRKGWPSNAALDEPISAVDGTELVDGTVAILDSTTGKWKTGAVNSASGKGALHAFIIAKEDLRYTYVGLLSDAIIEVDSDHYTGTTFKAGDPLSADENGKFVAAGSNAVIGKVINFDPVSKHMRLVWKPIASN